MSSLDPLLPLWQGRALVWALLFAIGLALVLALTPGQPHDRLVYFGLAAMVTLWITFAALGGLYVLRGWLARGSLQRVAWVGLALLVGGTWVVGATTWWILRPLWTLAGTTFWGLMLSLTGIVATVGLLSFAGLQNYWRAQALAARAQQAELALLHARIHPHFLFNALNTAIALVRARPAAAEQVLLDLADLFRATLASPQHVPLARELELTRHYLAIEQARLGSRLAVDWQLPDALPDIEVPALTLQPLAENAVRHGIERWSGGGRIRIEATLDAGMLRLRVRNPLPPPGGNVPGHRIGQEAVRARLQTQTAGSRLHAGPEGDEYVATLELPLPPQADTR